MGKFKEITKELAGWFPGDREFSEECVFCYGRVPRDQVCGTRFEAPHYINELQYHDDDCLWARAKKLMEE